MKKPVFIAELATEYTIVEDISCIGCDLKGKQCPFIGMMPGRTSACAEYLRNNGRRIHCGFKKRKTDTRSIVSINDKNYYINNSIGNLGCAICKTQTNCPFVEVKECISFCKLHGLDRGSTFERVPAETIISIKNIIATKKPVAKPFTINDVPDHALLTCRNGATYEKYGKLVSFYQKLPDGSESRNKFTWKRFCDSRFGVLLKSPDGKHGYDIVSIKEIIIGPELMQPEVFRYSVVDTEDNVLQTVESTKELHLVKDK